jgi:hypothetical protein
MQKGMKQKKSVKITFSKGANKNVMFLSTSFSFSDLMK